MRYNGKFVISSVVIAAIICAGLLIISKIHSDKNRKDSVERTILTYRALLEKQDFMAAYAMMSNDYTNRRSFAYFTGQAQDYLRRLAKVNGREQIDLSRRQARVYIPANSSSDLGFAIDLVCDSEWRIESLEGLWMNE